MSTRGRLTVSYAAMLMATIVVFAVAVWSERRSQENADLAGLAYDDAESMANSLRRAQERDSLHPLTNIDTSHRPAVARAAAALVDTLTRYPGYFIVFNNQDTVLFASPSIRELSPDDRATFDSAAFRLRPGVNLAKVSLRGDSLRLLMISDRVSVPPDHTVPNIARIVVGVPAQTVELQGQLLFGTVIVAAPLIIIVSVIVAYFVVGSAFRPVDQLINEVEAITDGRSLHRRLPADTSNDELARLSFTVNAMLTRLESSFAGLRRFTADASHELKTPLTVLRADVERAMHPHTARGDRMVALEEALQETARMSDLVNSLLTLARADEGRFDIHRTPVELDPLLREVYETATILGEDAGLNLSLAAMENGVVMGDRARLRQLFLNLVTNAIKYTPRGGHVELSATRRDTDEIAISVRDTGIGIAAADLPHVFDRFWRADRVRSRASERGGFGLGLAIAQWIVQAHGGTIAVASRLGRGSMFTVVLPIVREEARPEPGAAETETAIESADS
ncbi:MAG TPA: HAMP domain-containing sensor histidine kinase [Gemmatimonadaceae bacterium]|nr:HAMP domain-containing sensor histidine kinase [Gemmatimonadaceae bacterium]